MHVIGDIDGRNCVRIMDDMIDTAGTAGEGSRSMLKRRGGAGQRVRLLLAPHLLARPWNASATAVLGTKRL